MYVCICKAVTTGDIRQAVHQGARTLADLRQELAVATQCGRCASCAKHQLRECLTPCTDNQEAAA